MALGSESASGGGVRTTTVREGGLGRANTSRYGGNGQRSETATAVIGFTETLKGGRARRGETEPIRKTPEDSEKREAIREAGEGMRGILTKLLRMEANMGPDNFQRLAEESGHGRMINLMKDLTWFPPNERGGSKTINERNLNKLLSTENGVIEAYDLISSELAELQMQNGLIVSMGLDAPTQKTIKDQSIELQPGAPLWTAGRWIADVLRQPVGVSYGRGGVRGRLGRTFVGRTRGGAAARIGAYTAAGVAVALTVSNPVGWAAAALPVAYAAYTRLRRPGETLRTLQSTTSLNAAQALGVRQLEWMREYSQVDVRDWEYAPRNSNGDTRVRMRPGEVALTRVPMEDRDAEIKELAKARIDIQKTILKIRPEYRTATDVEFILRGTRDAPLRGSPLEMQAMTEFLSTPGLFRPGRRYARENFERYSEIKNRIAGPRMETNLRNIFRSEQDPLGDRIDSLHQRRTELQSEAERQRRIDVLDGQKAPLDRDKAFLDGGLSSLRTFRAKVDEARTEIAALRRRQEAAVGGVVVDWGAVAPVGATPVEQVQAALRYVLHGEGVGVIIDGHPEVRSIRDQIAALDPIIRTAINDQRTDLGIPGLETAFNTAQRAYETASLTAGTPRTVIEFHQRRVAAAQSALDRSQDLLTTFVQQRNGEWNDRQVELILQRQGAIQGLLDTLTANGTAIETAQDRLVSGETEGRSETASLFDSLQTARERLNVDPAPPAGPFPGLSLDIFATAPAGVLQTRINQAHEFGLSLTPPQIFGWPEAMNGDPENQQRILLARIEAFAGLREASIRTPSVLLTAALNPNVWNLQEAAVFALSPEEISARMIEQVAVAATYGTVLVPPNLNQIRAIKQEVGRRFTAREEAMSRFGVMVNTRVGQLNEQITTLREKGVSTKQLDQAILAVENYVPTMEDLLQLPLEAGLNQESIDRILALGEVGTFAGDNYWYMEAEAGELRAYVAILDKIFGYRKAGTIENQISAFETAREMIPPERLANIMTVYFRLEVDDGGVLRPPMDLEEAILTLRWHMGLPVPTPGGGEARRTTDVRLISQQQFATFIVDFIEMNVIGDAVNNYDNLPVTV